MLLCARHTGHTIYGASFPAATIQYWTKRYTGESNKYLSEIIFIYPNVRYPGYPVVTRVPEEEI